MFCAKYRRMCADQAEFTNQRFEVQQEEEPEVGNPEDDPYNEDEDKDSIISDRKADEDFGNESDDNLPASARLYAPKTYFTSMKVGKCYKKLSTLNVLRTSGCTLSTSQALRANDSSNSFQVN
ncbi:hypothetical protein N656DRAFT_768505 [Canariomyces notabilis]|uniref:Uncharacterized protein n=1 Tax=Canariomyces notabilis TaxID=2074819 RepID=A0AAN6TDD7_9PEZI|nr:hypothetical protein N656DRAFT_768505 [Canariomyces arenarius]